MVFTDGEVQAFRLYNDGCASGECPSCGAWWEETKSVEGVVFVIMQHSMNCAYLAWELAEDRAWMEY